jgi:hypothetical protein
MALPRDTITYATTTNIQDTDILVVNPPYTILGYAIVADATTKSNKHIKIGNREIAGFWSSDKALNVSGYIEIEVVGDAPLYIRQDSNTYTSYVINYVPRDRSLIPDPVSESTSSLAMIHQGFSYGEILTNYFLFIIMVACVFGFIINKFLFKK